MPGNHHHASSVLVEIAHPFITLLVLRHLSVILET